MVPESIPTHSRWHSEILMGVGESQNPTELRFTQGGWVFNQDIPLWWGMDIFWSNTTLSSARNEIEAVKIMEVFWLSMMFTAIGKNYI